MNYAEEFAKVLLREQQASNSRSFSNFHVEMRKQFPSFTMTESVNTFSAYMGWDGRVAPTKDLNS